MCNTKHTAVLSKKVCLHGEAGSFHKLCILELRKMEGGLQSTAGLYTVQSEKNEKRKEI